jgi:hypothetical protein
MMRFSSDGAEREPEKKVHISLIVCIKCELILDEEGFETHADLFRDEFEPILDDLVESWGQ